MVLKRLAMTSGMVAIVPLLLGLFIWFAEPSLRPFPDWLSMLALDGILAAIPLAIFSAFFWTKWMFVVALVAATMLVFVAYSSVGIVG